MDLAQAAMGVAAVARLTAAEELAMELAMSRLMPERTEGYMRGLVRHCRQVLCLTVSCWRSMFPACRATLFHGVSTSLASGLGRYYV